MNPAPDTLIISDARAAASLMLHGWPAWDAVPARHVSILEHALSDVAAAVKAKLCSMHVPILRCIMCESSRLLQLHLCRPYDQDLRATLLACDQRCEGMVADMDNCYSAAPARH